MNGPHDDEKPRHWVACNGYVVLGPDWKNFAATLVLLAAPIAAFFALVAPDIWTDVSWVLVVATAVAAITTYLALLITGLKSPGIIPRNEATPHDHMLPRSRDYMINGFAVVTKRCTTCSVYRPPRCSHCAVCNNCIEKFDHHCPWVGTCIGRRNYQAYLAFIYSCSVLTILVIAQCVTRITLLATDPGRNLGYALRAEPAAAVLLLYCCAGLLFVGALAVLHTYLLSTNQTTYEFFRHRYARSESPFSRTIAQNVYEACCGATGLYAYHGDTGHPAAVAHSAIAHADDSSYSSRAPTPPAAAHTAAPANNRGGHHHPVPFLPMDLPINGASDESAHRAFAEAGPAHKGELYAEPGSSPRQHAPANGSSNGGVHPHASAARAGAMRDEARAYQAQQAYQGQLAADARAWDGAHSGGAHEGEIEVVLPPVGGEGAQGDVGHPLADGSSSTSSNSERGSGGGGTRWQH